MAKAPRVSVQITADSTGYTASVNKAKAQLIDFGTASKRVHSGMVSDVQATSGALRLMEGGMTGNIRAAERFLASIKGIGTAMQFIYPAVGLIAVGAVIARGVEELTNFIKKTKEAGAEFRASFQEMQNSARLSNDELAKTNINLENQIAKLTGKHENVLAAQLIEARIQADNLAISAARAAKEMKDLLEKNSAGILSNIFLSKGVTTDVFGNINNFQTLKKQARQDQSDAANRGDQTAADAADKQYQQLLKNERAYLLDQRKQRTGNVTTTNQYGQQVTQSYAHAYGKQDTNLDAINAALDLNYDQSNRLDLDATNQKDTAQVKKIQDAQNVASKAKEAAAKLMEQYRQQFAQVQAATLIQPGEEAAEYHARMLTEEALFWSQKLSITKQGSIAYKDIQTQLAEIDRQANQQAAEAQNESLELAQDREKFISQSFGSDLDLTRNSDVMGELKGGGKDADSMLAAMNEGVTIARSNADAWAEAQIQIGQAAGTLSKYDAALQTLQLHRQQNDRANSDLAASRAALEQRYGPEASATTPEARAAYAQLNNQQSSLNGQYRVQSAQDEQAVAATTALGALNQELGEFVQKAKDGTQFVGVLMSAIGSVNDEIVKIISTRHNYGLRQTFGNLGAGMFRNIAGAGLQKGEGALLGALGLGGGKPDGSQGKPFHVIMAGIGGAASGAAGSIGSAVSKATGGIGGFIGKIGGFFSGLGFASGGQPPVGMASLVGENGPELFVPHTAGTIVPNGAFGGSSVTHTWNVDARGATDPAAVNAAVNRAIYKAQPALSAAAMNASRESDARKPSSARR